MTSTKEIFLKKLGWTVEEIERYFNQFNFYYFGEESAKKMQEWAKK